VPEPHPAAGDVDEPAGISVVVPTVGRPTLAGLLDELLGQVPLAPVPVEIIVVHDRPADGPLAVPPGVRVRRGAGRGPATARNRGWRVARYPWVAFIDDDVVPAPDWLATLAKDLDQPADVGGVQGRLTVPLPDRPGDWARCTAGLAQARWATADMAYRRDVLARVGGFDERFPRAYREDADLAYRVLAAGARLVTGERQVSHPVRPEGPWVSLRAQRGNADDALLRRLHGADWHARLEVPLGRRRRHALILGAGLAGVGLAVAGRAVPSPRLARACRVAAAVAGAGWVTGTAEFAAARLRDAPGDRHDPVPLMVTTVLIPPLAIAHWLRGAIAARRARPWSGGDSTRLDG
jgi:glycosyltransferase involved in cell wall biosynthesis